MFLKTKLKSVIKLVKNMMVTDYSMIVNNLISLTTGNRVWKLVNCC